MDQKPLAGEIIASGSNVAREHPRVRESPELGLDLGTPLCWIGATVLADFCAFVEDQLGGVNVQSLLQGCLQSGCCLAVCSLVNVISESILGP